MRKIAVIGGGAAGMMAAWKAACCGAQVTVLERQARLGKKLSVTGNGRCNLSNQNAFPEHYHGSKPSFPAYALEQFSTEKTLNVFHDMGLLTVTEADGKVYPLSDTAGSVLDVLRFALEAAGVEIRCGCEVQTVQKQKNGFRITWVEGELTADRVILACGGAAGEKAGGSVLGYRLAKSLGHHCSALLPSLVQLKVDGTLCKSLKGIRADGEVRVLLGKTVQASSKGEIQFTDYGLSGPAIFEISRTALQTKNADISINLLRGYMEEEITDFLRFRRDARPFLTLDDLFTGMLQNRLGRVVVKAAGFSGNTACSALTERELYTLAHTAANFTFRVIGDTGLGSAQVTAGGIQTNEVNPETMESLCCAGLFLCGELLDVDGDCGGYNLQWAWSSGMLAGRCASEV